MKFFNKLERRFGRYAIHGLMNYFVILYAVGFAVYVGSAYASHTDVYNLYMALDVEAIMHGQVWRLFTFLMYPPSTSLFWGILMIYLYFSLGRSLESVWGAFRFNVFMFMGILFHIIAAFILYFVFKTNLHLTPDNLNLSIFLAFAASFPDMSFMLYFVIPVKAKYLGIFYVIMEGFSFITGSTVGRVTIFLSLLNVVVFFIVTKNIFGNISYKKTSRRKEFNSQVKIKPVKSAHHKCAVCGRTELDGEDLVFRYCSKCNGNYEYCQDHLYTHTHVQ